MSKLYVIGNCYSDSEANAQELFGVLEDAGYTLGYNSLNRQSAVIMKEVIEEEKEEEKETEN